MLMVEKRLGRKEPFCVDKIKNSLAAASDELKQPLNSADLSHICDALEAQLEGRETVSSKEIFTTLLHILEEENYRTLAVEYEKSSSNNW